MSDSEEPVDIPDEGEDDLFGDGDGDDDEVQSNNERVLSDTELASEQDVEERDERDDRDDMDMEEVQERNRVIMNVQMYRHQVPRSKDGILSSMKVPSFVRVAADEYKPNTFEPTGWDKENVKSDNPKAVIRFQRDPTTGRLKSNALIHRWSDGSMTLTVGSEHFEIQKKPTAPPSDKPYSDAKDAHVYAAAAHLSSNVLLTVGHISEQYTVVPNRHIQDDAVAKFASRMAEMQRGKGNVGGNIFTATKDPELQRKEAELAEKEKLRAQRKRENAALRQSMGQGGYRAGGLSIGDLEGGRRGYGGTRKRGQPGASRSKRRRPEYDSDDDLPAGRGRNDEYDREDDFIAPSDEEGGSEASSSEEEEEILDDDEDEDEAPRSKRQRTAEASDEDADADADLEDIDEPAHLTGDSSRNRRRHIVDDDEDE